MKVVILSQFYAPEPLPKPHHLAEGLRERGHEVTVLTGFPNYPSGRLYPGYRLRPWSVEMVHGVRTVRLALYPDHSASSLRRIWNYASFAATASTLGPALCGTPDAMYVFHPPSTVGVAACLISWFRRVPFVYEVADLWPEAVVASGMMKSPFAGALVERVEHAVCARASAVAAVTPGIAEHLERDGVARHKLHVITDWADERVYRPVPPDPALAERLGMAGRFNVVFGGQVGLVQRLDTVVEAAAVLRPHPAIQFVIAGDGIDRARLMRASADRNLTNLRFLGQLPAEEMPRLYALADVLLVHLSAQAIFHLSVPAKTYAYMACEKPVLMAADGAAAELIRASGAGLACAPEDPGALAETVLEFFRMPPESRAGLGRRGREMFTRQYSRAVGVTRCEALLTAIAARTPSA
jgi:colanic acid biosynthesis glycosyl transferase WcaI